MKELRLLNGDCLDKLKELDNNSIDSIVTDPPYGLSFMGKKWDYDVPSVEIWQECLRVLKPGGHLLAFAGSRTYHRMAVRIEDAGFDIRDQIMWIYGSGFPKSHNVGKSIDKMQGNQRKVVGTNANITSKETNWQSNSMTGHISNTDKSLTKGNSIGEGWGTALKPAHEPIVMARKPIEGTVAENTLQYGVGGLNIDGTRIGSEVRTTPIHSTDAKEDTTLFGLHATIQHHREETTQGRWPANVILDEEAGQILDEQSGNKKSGKMLSTHKRHTDGSPNGIYGKFNPNHQLSDTYGDEGGASRFFYCPKANKKDREEGNVHPTVKPTDLMKYLIRLVTPKDGIVLDPFMGSGSTGKAAMQEGMWFVGIEREKEYFEIAKQRIEYEADKRKFW
jgi:site-specific DNA-methyltransferase (adenine-specific)